MNIDITRLKSGLDEYTDIDIMYSFSKEQLVGTDILSLDNVQIQGRLEYTFQNYVLQVDISGVMVLPCAVTLKPVNYPFSISIEEEIGEETQESFRNVQNTIDIFPIIWENILMEIPLRVVSDDISDVPTEGEGWKFITEEDQKEQ